MKNFHVITKSQLAHAGRGGVKVEEVCGPASIAMLLQCAGYSITFDEVLCEMRRAGAYVEGTGTILKKVPSSFDAPMRYARYLPTILLALVLNRGFLCAHSIKGNRSNHIVFVYRISSQGVHFFDPNRNNDLPACMSLKEWRSVSNHRLVWIKAKERLDPDVKLE